MVRPIIVVSLAVAMAVVHLVAGRLRFLQTVPRSRWLSAAGGISVAYVFVHLLPEISERREHVVSAGETATNALGVSSEQVLFLAALFGFAVFYGLEQLAHRSRRSSESDRIVEGLQTRTSGTVFWIHTGSFAVYNALIGYLLLHRETTGLTSLLLYATAMAVHFLVNDYGLREHHQEAYDRASRWLLAGALLVGLGVGFLADVSELHLSLLLSFLAGGVVLNVVKEELPEERESRFWAFGAGTTAYAGLLLLL